MSFSGGVESDFMKLVKFPDFKKPNLINFAGTDFLSFRNSLINYAKAVYPGEYEYFVESDLGMMFLELAAYVGSVVSLKADMLANENFLATARQRSSVKKLLELIGVRLRGPISSVAQAKLDFNNDPGYVGTFGPTGSPPFSEQTVIIPAQSRIIETISAEDGGSLNFTLYKVIDGLIEPLSNSQGNLELIPKTEGLGTNKAIFENLVIQEGSLVKESGDFAATEGLKSIELQQFPVAEQSVQVFITDSELNTGGTYTEVDNIYFASGATDKVFEVIYDDSYKATIVFGDGVTGESPSNSASYTVLYRVGGGSRGNISVNSINQDISDAYGSLLGPTYPATGVLTNTSKGVGGSNSETLEHAKKYAPLTFRRQDRLVTLLDYTTFANTFIGNFGTAGKATAVVRKAFATANTIDIYILEKASDIQLQKATTNFKTELLTAINEKKMATDEVVLVDGLIRTLDLITTIKIDKIEELNQEQIKIKVRDKILNYMSIDNRDFGQELNISELNREIFEVDEVRFSSITNLDQNVPVDFNEIIQLNNIVILVELLD